MRSISLLSLIIFLISCEHAPKAAHTPIPWNKLNPKKILELKFLSVDDDVISHPREKRGFVSTPLSYKIPEVSRINIFYRFIPCNHCQSTDDPSKPVIVLINDGPGKSSQSLRSYNKNNSKLDTLTFLTEHFHVLVLDQRGTGYSSPLDLDDSGLRPELIAQLFDSYSIAEDHGIVIRKILKRRSFYLMGSGFGNMVLYKYLFQKHSPQPKTYIFSSSSIPPYNFIKKYRSQRRLQTQLNYQMQKFFPAFESKVIKLKNHLKKNDLNPQYVNSLYKYLGNVQSRKWERDTIQIIKRLLKMNEFELESYFSYLEEGPNLLRYILSARSFTPGKTDRTLHNYFNQYMPLRPWMLNGFWENSYFGDLKDNWKGHFLSRIDKFPPPSTRFANLHQLSRKFKKTSSLFVFGREDKNSEVQFRRKELKWFKSTKVQVVEVPGSQGFIFEKGGVQLLKRLLNKN